MQDPVIVVGGGLAGLAAAATVARAGVAVELLEASAHLGGRARSTGEDGFRLNLGPHALYRGGPGERVLTALGIRPAGRKPSLRRHRLLVGDELRPAPYTPRGFAATRLLSVRERATMLAAVASLGAVRPQEHREVSIAAWLAERTPDGTVRELLGALVRLATYAADLDLLPASVALGQLKLALRPGVLYLHGGWAGLVDALGAVATNAGAEVRYRGRVTALLPDQDRPGVRLDDGEERRGSTVILAGLAPAAAARLLRTAGGEDPLHGAARSVRAACLDVALAHRPRADRPFVLGLDEPLYLAVHSDGYGARVAPSGGAVVHAARYLAGSPRGGQADRAQLEALLDLAQPGWRDHVVHARFSPRLEVVSHAPRPGEDRPSVDATGVPRVLLAGDWVGDEGWLADATLASAARAADQAVALRAEARVTLRAP